MSSNTSPSTISACLAQNFGYSKSILGAIFEKESNSLSPRETSINSNDTATSNPLLKTTPVEPNAASNTFQQTSINGNGVQSTPISIRDAITNEFRQRKSLSCDLSGVSEIHASPSNIDSSQKSQSLREVDQITAKSSIVPDNGRSSGKEGVGPPSTDSTPSILRCGSATARTASTVSNSSKSSKDKESIQESIPFAICAAALYACANRDTAGLKELLQEHPGLLNYAYPHCYRLTCLHIAAKSGNLSLIRYLAGRGANLNARDDNWATPLHLAAKANKPEAMRLLRSLGADSRILDGYGRTARSYLAPGENIENEVSQTPLSHLGNSINSMMTGITGFNTISAANSPGSASISASSTSFLTQPLQRMGSLRPLKRKVNKVKDLFGV